MSEVVYKGRPGETIAEACIESKRIAQATGNLCSVDFNGITVKSGKTAADMVSDWWIHVCNEQRARVSPEVKALIKAAREAYSTFSVWPKAPRATLADLAAALDACKDIVCE